MNVTTHWTNRPAQKLTRPFPLENGLFVAVRSGSFYSPDSWKVAEVNFYMRGTIGKRPFLSFRWGCFGFYVGWKVYGVDTENQRAMPGINVSDVYVGSIAIQGCTIRFTRGLT